MIGIVGAGGHSRVIVDIFKRRNGQETFIQFSADPRKKGQTEVVLPDTIERLLSFQTSVNNWHIAIGDPFTRKQKQELLLAHHFDLITAMHDQSTCAEQSDIGVGSSIMAGAVVNPYAVIGRGCIINTLASVDHDCVIEDYVNLGPGCRLAGGVKIGELSDLGMGALVIPNKTIGRGCVIGAGSVVISDIPDYSVAVGVPARIIKQADWRTRITFGSL